MTKLLNQNTAAVQFFEVGKSFDGGKTQAIRDITFEIQDGESLVLLGSSGSGKSTILRCVNRLIEPTDGRVIVAGRETSDIGVLELRRSIGYVSQAIALFPFLNIIENIGLPLRARGIAQDERRARALESLSWVSLGSELATRYPHELSGGQQQRVGVARALVTGCDILLMDEPFGALDAVNRELLQELLLRIKDEHELTLLFVTHDLMEALVLADRIGVMHDGKLEQLDQPARIMANPATDFVRAIFEKPKRQLEALSRPA